MFARSQSELLARIRPRTSVRRLDPERPLGASPERDTPQATRRIPPQNSQSLCKSVPPNLLVSVICTKSAQITENRYLQVPVFCDTCALFSCKPRVFSILTKTPLGVYVPMPTTHLKPHFKLAALRKQATEKSKRDREVPRLRLPTGRQARDYEMESGLKTKEADSCESASSALLDRFVIRVNYGRK
jgi:hypothetical protein